MTISETWHLPFAFVKCSWEISQQERHRIYRHCSSGGGYRLLRVRTCKHFRKEVDAIEIAAKTL